MSSGNQAKGQIDDCGCCIRLAAETPVKIDNRAGLSAISYRIGTHNQFKETMLADLLPAKVPMGNSLSTRDSSDFSIALLDAWATVADVLTFYQERIANESYLRTATERVSMQSLARLVGYEPDPGVAASANLAFTVEEQPELPEDTLSSVQNQLTTQGMVGADPVTIEAGSRVQSIPGQDKLPQTFETIEKIEARAAWNGLRPRLTRPQSLNLNGDTIYLKGAVIDLRAGDTLLLVTGTGAGTATRRRIVKSLQSQPQQDRTRVELVAIVKQQNLVKMVVENQGVLTSQAVFSRKKIDLSKSSVKQYILEGSMDDSTFRTFVMKNNWEIKNIVRTVRDIRSGGAGAGGEVHVFREQVGFFGHNSPYYPSLKDNNNNPLFPELFDWDTNGWEIWKDNIRPEKTDNHSILLNAAPGSRYYSDADVYLERPIQGIFADSWAHFMTSDGKSETYKITNTNEKSIIGFGISTKGTGLLLEIADGTPLKEADKPPLFKIRNSTAYVKSEKLELAEEPVQQTLLKGTNEIYLDRIVEGLTVEKPVVISGDQQDGKGRQSEIHTISRITHCSGYTKLTFREGMQAAYIYDTVVINANVALATHGETVTEILGSGDTSMKNQRFVLRQPPLTYIRSSTSGGSESTLEVRANDLLWKEVPTLYGHAPDERIYTVRTNLEGATVIEFGDGQRGQRLPTGRENIRARYRRGIGSGGLVSGGQLSLLMTRPLGLKGVLNPHDAAGAGDPESIDSIQRNASTRILALGRTVSLKDYEDFVRAYPGIGKALATSTWFGEKRGIFITVATSQGKAVDQDFLDRLTTAVKDAGDHSAPVLVKQYRKALFTLQADMQIDSPTYQQGLVFKAVREKLEAVYSFSARDLGQGVILSEITTVIQGVPGVVAVDINVLKRTDKNDNGLHQPLDAERPIGDKQGLIYGAELLMIDVNSIDLREMQ